VGDDGDQGGKRKMPGGKSRRFDHDAGYRKVRDLEGNWGKKGRTYISPPQIYERGRTQKKVKDSISQKQGAFGYRTICKKPTAKK